MRDSSGGDGNRTRTLLIAGTASHVGKSTVAAGLCRLLAARGVSVAPFKAQNMSNNARVVVRAQATVPEGDRERGDEWGEIGVSQFVQARAAGMTPTTDCNPVLLKPRGDGESQLVIDGRAVGHVAAGEYYADGWHRAREAAAAAHDRLAREHEVIVAEGAGSIAEINLRERDLANLETARFGDATILLLVDIERGGAFASLYGTLALLPADVRERVGGAVVTKFRGDASLLEPGIAEIESLTGTRVLGVIPYDDPGLPAEDSVSLPAADEAETIGADDGVPEDCCVRIAVPRLPRLSNATDLEALAAEPGVRVAFVPVSGDGPNSSSRGIDPRSALERAHAIVVPGTKNTVDDLLALRASEVGAAIRDFDGPVVGLCGGYQLLGERLTHASREGTGDGDTVAGLGLLPVETRFAAEKHLERTTVDVDGIGPIAGASGVARGYEIHAGRTIHLAPVDRPLEPESAATEDVLGTYLHGLFDNQSVRSAFLETVARRTGIDRPVGRGRSGGTNAVGPLESSGGETPYDRAARLVREHVDLEALDLPGT